MEAATTATGISLSNIPLRKTSTAGQRSSQYDGRYPAQARGCGRFTSGTLGGKSPRQIADELIQRKILSPGASYRRRRPCARYGTWSASVLHGELDRASGILCNPIYIGKAPERERSQLRLNEVESEIENIMTAIKAGILTATTKAELEKAESERTRLLHTVSTAQADKVATTLPRA